MNCDHWQGSVVLLSLAWSQSLWAHPLCAQPLASVGLVPYRDPWPLAQPRFQDIANRTFNAWIDPILRRSNGKFQYTSRQVVLFYQKHPSGSQFVGRISARGLKPNFCYQMKLLGKPVDGQRGWKIYGDDTANERLGRAGRWWDDESDASTTNVTDWHYQNTYLDQPRANRRTIYGYLYLGAFVTDTKGNYRGPVKGNNSYHVTWQSWQLRDGQAVDQNRFQEAGSWKLAAKGGYGYGPSQLPVKLVYEYETGRPQPVRLPPGNYNCRFLLTEESFHNSLASTPEGGTWQSVLASEDFSSDAAGNLVPDQNPANDVSFTIGPGVQAN